jgi:hypothetical protein
MRADHERLRTFIELRSLIGWSVNDNWNVQINSLAAPVFQPSFCVMHKNQDKRYFPVWGQMSDGGFQPSISGPYR